MNELHSFREVIMSQVEQVLPFEAVPQVVLPEDYQWQLGPLLADAYMQHGPIFRSTYFGRDIVYMVGPEANRFVLVQNRQKFSNFVGWGSIFEVVNMFGRGLLSMDGAEHDHDRKIMNPAFTVSYMDRYLPLMNRVIREQVATWAERGEVDVYEEMRSLTFAIAAEALAGLRAGEEVERFRDLYGGLLEVPRSAQTDEEFNARVHRIQDELGALLLPKIQERRLHPTDDVFGLLVQAKDIHGQTMSDEQLIAHANILLVAGHETSTSLSSWLLYLLTQHPAYTQRILTEQEQVLGQRADPDRFAPPREEHKKHPYALVGFGGGPRICIGINFAQVEIKALVSHILRNYDLELVPDQPIAQFYGVTGRPANGIRMHVKRK
jgi:cytochrome P450